jgi:hypothetical protein
MILKLTRVRYGKASTPRESREYQIDGDGPVGTIAEYEQNFPDAVLVIDND